jgi:hypothetical protein
MTKKKISKKEKVLYFCRFHTREEILRTFLGALIGVTCHIALYLLKLPSYKLIGLLTVRIDLAILVIPIVAAFFGPLAGLLVGLFGTLGADGLFAQHIIALGLINLSYGLLGFIVGIPHYTEGEGFSKGRTLGKLILSMIGGYLVMALIYLGGLIVIAGQNVLPTLLYNFLPFFSASLITLFIVAPVAVRLTDILANYVRKRIL